MSEQEFFGIVEEPPAAASGGAVVRRAPQTVMTQEADSLERAEKDLMTFDRVRNLAVALTKPRDWVAFPGGDAGERAWPTRSACNKLATAMKISTGTHINQQTGRPYTKLIDRDEKGEFYTIEVNGWVEMPGFRRFDVMGFCSSRHKFFASTGKRDGEGNIIYKPMSEVSLANIIQTAYTNFQANATMRMLGFDNMSAEEIEALLGGKVSRVQYASGQSTQTAEEKAGDDVKRKKLWAICLAMRGGVESEAGTLLQAMTQFTVTEDGKEKTIPGVKDAAKLKDRRLARSLGDAEKRLAEWFKTHPDRKEEVEAAIAKYVA
jgi:hypothetical protein